MSRDGIFWGWIFVLRHPTELLCVVSGQGASRDRTFVSDSDASIEDHWTRHEGKYNADGSKVYHRTRIPTPPLEVQEAYHRLKPVADIIQGRKQQIRQQRRLDPVVYARALKLAERRKRLAAAPVGSGAELQGLLRRRFNVNVAAPSVADFLQTAGTSGLQTVDPELADPHLPVVSISSPIESGRPTAEDVSAEPAAFEAVQQD